MASQYNVTRAKNRALVNIAVLNSENSAVTAAFRDSSNLLGQTQELNFRKVQEGDAIYLAELLHSDEDVQRLNIRSNWLTAVKTKLSSIRKCTGPTDGRVFASGNAGKVIEMQQLLAPVGLQLKSLKDFGLSGAEETATTFVENALIKAKQQPTRHSFPP